MTELVKIQEHQGKTAVSARELYEKLGYNKAVWSRWFKKNIIENQFAIENEDWQGFNVMLNGNFTQDFALSIDFAKKLSMMARTEAGERIRQYFIEVERKLKEQQQALTPAEALLKQVELMVRQEKEVQALKFRTSSIESKVNELEARTTTSQPTCFAIMGYARLHNIPVSLHLAATLGTKAKRICQAEGYRIETVPDPRFGRVNIYPKTVLDRVFGEVVF